MTILEIMNNFYEESSKTFLNDYKPQVYNVQTTGENVSVGLRFDVFGQTVKQHHTLSNDKYVVRNLIEKASLALLKG